MANPWALLVIGFVLIGLTMIEFQDLGFDVSIIPFSLDLGFAVASIIPFCLGLYYTFRDKRPKTERVYYYPNDEIKKRKKEEAEELEKLEKNRELKLKMKKSNTLVTSDSSPNDTRYCRDCLIPIDYDSKDGYCAACKPDATLDKNSVKLPSNTSASLKFNENFANKIFDFNEGLESVIEINYKAPKESKVKLFFSNDDFKTFSRNYTELKDDNFVRFIIRVAGKTYSSLISGGNYDFDDSFDRGYTLHVSMKYEDSELLKKISNVLREHKFGCLPTRHSIHAHKNEKYPMDHLAVKLLSEITKEVSMAI